MSPIRCLLAVCVVGCNAAAHSQETDSAADATQFSLFLDNDVLLFGADNEDRNYTMGLALAGTGPWIRRLRLDRPRRLADRLSTLATVHERLAGSGQGFDTVQLGLSAFTPDDLRASDPQPDDRPYASLLYLQSQRQSVNASQTRSFSTQLSLGVLGLNLADWFQTTLHKAMQDGPDDTPYLPQGWHLQISDGGEPTFRYAAKWQGLARCTSHFDAQWTMEAHAGYYTNVAAGGALRIGRMRTPWWSFSPSPIVETQVNVRPRAQTATASGRRTNCTGAVTNEHELYFWAGAVARAWAYNVLLQGQFHDAPSTIRAGLIERLVGEYQLGITWAFAPRRTRHSLSFAYARRSPEFDGPQRRYHSWGGLYYSVGLRGRE